MIHLCIYSVPCTGAKPLVLTYLILISTLWGKNFIEEKMKVERLRNLPELTQLLSGRAGVWAHVLSSKAWASATSFTWTFQSLSSPWYLGVPGTNPWNMQPSTCLFLSLSLRLSLKWFPGGLFSSLQVTVSLQFSGARLPLADLIAGGLNARIGNSFW